MGLPVKLVCVANSNDGIAQMVGSGFYKLSNVKPSLAPAMDIKVWFLCIFNKFLPALIFFLNYLCL